MHRERDRMRDVPKIQDGKNDALEQWAEAVQPCCGGLKDEVAMRVMVDAPSSKVLTFTTAATGHTAHAAGSPDLLITKHYPIIEFPLSLITAAGWYVIKLKYLKSLI